MMAEQKIFVAYHATITRNGEVVSEGLRSDVIDGGAPHDEQSLMVLKNRLEEYLVAKNEIKATVVIQNWKKLKGCECKCPGRK